MGVSDNWGKAVWDPSTRGKAKVVNAWADLRRLEGREGFHAQMDCRDQKKKRFWRFFSKLLPGVNN